MDPQIKRIKDQIDIINKMGALKPSLPGLIREYNARVPRHLP